MANFKEGELALKDYQSVKYFPFGNEPAGSYVLTANPFSYLNAWLQREIKSFKRSGSERKTRLEKALYFNELADSFDKAAMVSSMPAKATLLYYAQLNLVKAFLLVNGIDLETTIEHHGLSLPSNKETHLKIQPPPDGGISIFYEFSKLLGTDISSLLGKEVSIDDLLFELPEVHEIGFALKIFTEKKRKFLPINISIITNEIKRNKLFYEICWDKKNEKIMPVHRFSRGILKDRLKLISTSEVQKRYRSNLQTKYLFNSDPSWQIAYKKIVEDLNEIGATTLLTREGYRYYLNLTPLNLHRLSCELAFMYYLGSVARYRPTLNESILNGEYLPLINEVIDSCPTQFYYYLVSLTTKQICAVPKAKLN